MGRAPRQSERSAYYGVLLEPPKPTPAILAAASAPAAQTAVQHDELEARKTTRPAPKSRSKAPRGRSFDDAQRDVDHATISSAAS
ncbi:MAG: hypothetical protein ABSD03_17465 [Vulcanimicrobiaceae bacterium]|jgi:hypothetical protein